MRFVTMIRALATILSSLGGAMGSGVSTWITQRHADRRDLLARRMFHREQLYSDFITETTRILADALENSFKDVNGLIPAYALLSRIRLGSSRGVLASAGLLREIIRNYSDPKLTPEQIRSRAVNENGNDPLLAVNMVGRPFLRFAIVVVIALIVSLSASAQIGQTPAAQHGRIFGSVTDVNGDAIIGATVVLVGPDSSEQRTVATPENGFFEFDAVKPGIPYQVSVSATGFAEWTSLRLTLNPGEFKLLDNVQLRIATEHSSVEVTYKPEEVATEQLKLEEKQRVLGIIPNFYVAYDSDAEPLTTKLKFALAWKVSYDPVTIAGVALLAGAKQAANSPDYGQGAQGYGKRFGAIAADGFTDIMIGGAILPSLLHQDPRYFYQGTGSTKSRIRHAVLSPFISKSDNGKWGPNYSSLGGDLASAAIANIYYPRSNRGAGLVFGNFAIGTAERVGASLAQEFLLGKLTHRAGHIK